MTRRRKDSIFKNSNSSTKTLEILRSADRVMDSINDMGSPPSLWKKFSRQAKRELYYAAAVSWQIPMIAAIWLGIAMLLFAIVF